MDDRFVFNRGLLRTFITLATIAALSGCAVELAPAPQPMRLQTVAQTDDVVILPPVPTFITYGDCEMAYGSGACATGSAVFLAANLTAPDGSANWYIPLAFGGMTGVLQTSYFAPPATYVSTVEYRTYVSQSAMQRYRRVDRTQIEAYRRAPTAVKAQAFNTGTARYSPSSGTLSTPTQAHARDATKVEAAVRATPAARPVANAPAALANRPVMPVQASAIPQSRTVRSNPAAPTPPLPQRLAAVAPPPAQPQRAAAARSKPCNHTQPKSANNCAA